MKQSLSAVFLLPFLFPLTALAASSTDLNRDESVDLADYAVFQRMFTGGGCQAEGSLADLDGNSCVDLRDFVQLHASFLRGCADTSGCGVQDAGDCKSNSFPNVADKVEVHIDAKGIALDGNVADAIAAGAVAFVDAAPDEGNVMPGPNGDNESPRNPGGSSPDPNGFNIARAIVLFVPDSNPTDSVDDSFLYFGWDISDSLSKDPEADGLRPRQYDSDDNNSAMDLGQCDSVISCAVSDELPENYTVNVQACTDLSVFAPGNPPLALRNPRSIVTDFDARALMLNSGLCTSPLFTSETPGSLDTIAFPTADGFTNLDNACIDLEVDHCATGNDLEFVIKRVETSGAFGPHAAATPDSQQARENRVSLAQLLVNLRAASSGDESDEESANAALQLALPEIEVRKRVRCDDDGQQEFTNSVDALIGSEVEFEIVVENTGNRDLDVTLTDVLAEVGAQAALANCAPVCDSFEARLTSPRRGINNLLITPAQATSAPVCPGLGDPNCLNAAFFSNSCNIPTGVSFLEGVSTGAAAPVGTLLGATTQRSGGNCSVTLGDRLVITFRATVGATNEQQFCATRVSRDCENRVTATAKLVGGANVVAQDTAATPDTTREKQAGNTDDNVVGINLRCRDIDFAKAVGFPDVPGSYVSGSTSLDVPSIPPGGSVQIEYIYAVSNEGEVPESVFIRDPGLCDDIFTTEGSFPGGIVLVDCQLCDFGEVGPAVIVPGGADFGASCIIEFTSQAALRDFLTMDDFDGSCTAGDSGERTDDCYVNCAEATADATNLGTVCRPPAPLLVRAEFATICNSQCLIDVRKQVRCLPNCSAEGLGVEEGWVEGGTPLDVIGGACVQYRILVKNTSKEDIPLCAVKYDDLMLHSDLFASGPTNVQMIGKSCTNLNFANSFNWNGNDVICKFGAPLAPGETVTVRFEGKLISQVSNESENPRNQITAMGAATGDCPTLGDPTFSCQDKADVSIDPHGCDFTVEKDVTCDDPRLTDGSINPGAVYEADDLADALPGGEIGFRIQVCNNGDVAIHSIDLDDALGCASWYVANSVVADIDGTSVTSCLCGGGQCANATSMNGLKSLAACDPNGIEPGECLTITFKVKAPVGVIAPGTPIDCTNEVTVRAFTDICTGDENSCPERSSLARVNVDVPEVECGKAVCADLNNDGECEAEYAFDTLVELMGDVVVYPLSVIWRLDVHNTGETPLASSQVCDPDLWADLDSGIAGVTVGPCAIAPTGCALTGPLAVGGSSFATCQVRFETEQAWADFAALDEDRSQFCYSNRSSASGEASTDGYCSRGAETGVEDSGCEAQICIEPPRIPAVSTWGLIILALVLLTLAKIQFEDRRGEMAS